MSSVEEIESKAGHPPALKVGGMRVAQRHRKDSDDTAAAKPPRRDGDTEEEEEELETSRSPPKTPLVVSGMVSKIDRDYPTEAVKHTHDKPHPVHESRSAAGKPNIIQQPRK